VIYCWIFNSLSLLRRFFSSLAMICVIHNWQVLNWLFKPRGSLIRSLFFFIVNLFDVTVECVLCCSTVSSTFMWLTSISKSNVCLLLLCFWVLIWIVSGWIILHAFIMTNGIDLRWLSMKIYLSWSAMTSSIVRQSLIYWFYKLLYRKALGYECFAPIC